MKFKSNPMDPELLALLEAAKNRKMTYEERLAQSVSWVASGSGRTQAEVLADMIERGDAPDLSTIRDEAFMDGMEAARRAYHQAHKAILMDASALPWWMQPYRFFLGKRMRQVEAAMKQVIGMRR